MIKNENKMESQEVTAIQQTSKEAPINIYEQVEHFLRDHYSFRYNTVKGQLECLNTTQERYEPLTDRIEYSVLRNIRQHHIKCDSTTLRSILISDFTQAYDPFKAYFNELADWDGQDHIQQLADTVKTTKTDLWARCLKKWLVASVGSLLDMGIINHTVLVFSGKQGIGKTTWMEKLVPDTHRDYLFSGTVNPDNKDTLINLAECWLINLDELENLNRSEIGSLKEMITKSNIRLRRPYGHNNENLPRRASFVGSVNSHQFLTDTTGSRRFLCFEAEDIQFRHEVNMHQVYAQAIYLLNSGFQHWLNKEDVAEIEASNEQYYVRTPEEELLLTYFQRAGKDDAEYYMNASQIIQQLSERGVRISQNSRTQQALGSALAKHGFERIKKGGLYVYALNEHSDVEVEVDKQSPREIVPSSIGQTVILPRNPRERLLLA